MEFELEFEIYLVSLLSGMLVFGNFLQLIATSIAC